MKPIWKAVGLGAVLGAAGCRAPEPSTVRPRTGEADEVAALFAAGRDPAEFFIHAYRTPEGRPVFTGQNRMPPNERAILLFESPPHSALPVIRTRSASGAELFVLVDTTSRQNWTNLEWRGELGFEPVGPMMIGALPAHVFDETPGYLCVLPELTIDRLRVESVLIYARTERRVFWPLHRHADARQARAVMGVDLLRGFAYVTWDFTGRMMTFSSTVPYDPDPSAVLAELPVDFDPDLGAIEVPWWVDGVESRVIFDCAGDYEVALDDPPLELIRQIGLQDLVLRRVRAVEPAEVGLQPVETPYLGTALLRRYRVTLDNRRNTLWIESAGRAPRAPPGDRADGDES